MTSAHWELVLTIAIVVMLGLLFYLHRDDWDSKEEDVMAQALWREQYWDPSDDDDSWLWRERH